jgi:hypothetical protein
MKVISFFIITFPAAFRSMEIAVSGFFVEKKGIRNSRHRHDRLEREL